VPVAVNGWTSPVGMLGLARMMVINWRDADVTVSTVEPATPPNMAVMVDVPGATPVARPCEPAALEIVATAVLLEAQETWVVRFLVVLSE
jgi:hypothetical protein